jgi:hypothetical protein
MCPVQKNNSKYFMKFEEKEISFEGNSRFSEQRAHVTG